MVAVHPWLSVQTPMRRQWHLAERHAYPALEDQGDDK